jgi:hypothetical protein
MIHANSRWRSWAAGAAAALLAVLTAPAQEVQPPPPGAPDPAEQTAPGRGFQPGFIHEFGRWLEEGASKLKSGMEGARDGFDKLGGSARETAKEATGTIMTLPAAKAVTARELCKPAPNGAPDCESAAATLCRGKGFQGGKSLDVQTEQKCPAKLLLSGRAPNDGDCRTEIFVTRAMCQ